MRVVHLHKKYYFWLGYVTVLCERIFLTLVSSWIPHFLISTINTVQLDTYGSKHHSSVFLSNFKWQYCVVLWQGVFIRSHFPIENNNHFVSPLSPTNKFKKSQGNVISAAVQWLQLTCFHCGAYIYIIAVCISHYTMLFS